MTLLELSAVYAENAAVLHGRITELRRMVRLEPDRETARALQRRVEALLPLWREARSLARITAHYYGREALGGHLCFWTPRGDNGWPIWRSGAEAARRTTVASWSSSAKSCEPPADRF